MDNSTAATCGDDDAHGSNPQSATTASSAEGASVPFRTILLVGQTCGGKSTLANVLVGDMEDRTFKVSATAQSEDVVVPHRDVQVAGKTWRIIDTMGIGDPIRHGYNIMEKLSKVADIATKEGVHKIFFVSATREIRLETLRAFNILQNLFGPNVGAFTTIVRTHFAEFDNPRKCKEDEEALERGRFSGLIVRELTGTLKVMYVNLPPSTAEGDDPNWRSKRKYCRQKLIAHLLTQCSQLHKSPVPFTPPQEDLYAQNKSLKQELLHRDELYEEVKKRLEVEKELAVLKARTESKCTIS